jgi:hypothetical protein
VGRKCIEPGWNWELLGVVWGFGARVGKRHGVRRWRHAAGARCCRAVAEVDVDEDLLSVALSCHAVSAPRTWPPRGAPRAVRSSRLTRRRFVARRIS